MAPKPPAPKTKGQRDAQAARERYETRSRRLAEEEQQRNSEAKPEAKQAEREENSDAEMKGGKRTKTQKPSEKKQKSSDKDEPHDTKALSKLWQKHYVMIDRFEDEYHHLRERMIQFHQEREDVTIVTLQHALAKANDAFFNYTKSQDDIVDSDDLDPEDDRIKDMCERNSALNEDLKKLKDAILEIAAHEEKLIYEKELTKI